jgi:hypothetical protein
MARRSFNTEPGWYHEARQAFVPEQEGMKAFVFVTPMKMGFCFVLVSLNSWTYQKTYASPFRSVRPCRKSILIGRN